MYINYSIKGNQTPIVFLHGWGQSMMMMDPLARLLSHDYQCVNLDLFGFGSSDEIRPYQGLDDYMEAFAQFLRDHEIHEPVLIAHSFGARIALRYAAKYPVKALVLTSAAGVRSPLSLKKRWTQWLHKKGIQVKGSYDYEHASVFLKKVLVEAVNQDDRKLMKKIKAEVLLVWGDKDTSTPLWMAKKMEQTFEHATLVVFKGEDHFAYYHESARFCFVVKEFLLGLGL